MSVGHIVRFCYRVNVSEVNFWLIKFEAVRFPGSWFLGRNMRSGLEVQLDESGLEVGVI